MELNILLNVSDIAIITGDNIFKSKQDFLIEFWRKNNKADFENYQNITECIIQTDQDIINKVGNIKMDLTSKCTNDLSKLKKDIAENIKHLPKEEQKIITKSATNILNTDFGTRNENDALQIYENMTGQKIVKDNRYRKKSIFENENISVSIGGRIDGINVENGDIIEIKNRVHKLFYKLRDYEKVQLMCYLYIFDSKEGQLVEAYKGSKDNININIINVPYNKDYMEKIIENIIMFAKFYKNFINDHNYKINLLNSPDLKISFIL